MILPNKLFRNLLLVVVASLSCFTLASSTATADAAMDAGVRRSIQHQSSPVHACLDKSFRRAPMMFGRLVVSFWIGADGRVYAPRVVRAPSPDRQATNCVVKAISLWSFQPPQNRKPLSVTYEFMYDLQDARG